MGSSPQPQPLPSPMEQAQAQMAIDAANAQRAEEARIREQQLAAEKEAKQRQDTQSQLAQLLGTGSSFLGSKIGSLGYQDNYGIADSFMNSLNAAKAQVSPTSTDPGSYFNFDQMFRDAVGGAQTAQQTKLHNQFMDYTPVGWETKYISNDAGRDLIDAILGNQREDVDTRFSTALARGQMSSGAYDNAARKLEQQASGGRSQLQDILDGVLGGYREDLRGIANQYNERIQNYNLGQNLNLSDMTAMKQQRAGELLGRLEGDFNRSVGDTQLFNPDAIMARANTASGTTNNPLRNAFVGAAANDDQKKTTDDRTTGTSGIF